MRYLTLAAAVLVSALPLASHGQQVASDGVALVRSLYQRYAWEAAEQPSRGHKAFVEEPRGRLEEFLEPGLAELLRKDRECVERTREVCNLSFSPLWASQDPGAKDLLVQRGAGNGVVQVQFTYPGNGKQVLLRFTVVATRNGTRISDIEYDRGVTLRKVLGG